MAFDEYDVEVDVDEANSHVHDVSIMFSGDSPHPTRLECLNCEWVGEVRDGV